MRQHGSSTTMTHAPSGPGPTLVPRALSTNERFRATVGEFEDVDARRTIDLLAQWVEEAFRDDLRQRPSTHVYTRTLPPRMIALIDQLRGSTVIHAAIRRQFHPSCALLPMTQTDELYISHYNRDGGGDQGLFDKHYDGNLGFLRFVSVVRALIYLQSDASYTVVFDDSQVRRAFGTYEFGLLDFHRELHWVEGEYRAGAPQRILLKCNYMMAPPGFGPAVRAAMAANTAVFYVVKAAMEYSKSPQTMSQRAVGRLCNVARAANNVSPLLPLGVAAALMLSLCAGLVVLLTQ